MTSWHSSSLVLLLELYCKKIQAMVLELWNFKVNCLFSSYFLVLIKAGKGLTITKSLAMLFKFNASVIDLCTYSTNKLLSRHSVILLLRNVLILRNEENDLSEVAVVTGKVKYNFKSLSTSFNIPLSIELVFLASDIVLTLVTLVTGLLSEFACAIISFTRESCVFRRSSSNK